MTNEEKLLFELIDRLDQEDVAGELHNESLISAQMHPSIVDPDSSEAINRIKERTLALLQQSEMERQVPRKRFIRLRRIAAIAAAAIAVLLAVAGFGTSVDVQAELKKVLYFLPGLGAVQESEGSQAVFVLEKPYVQPVGQGILTIDAIVLQNDGSVITLRGEHIPEVEKFKAEIGDRTFTFHSFMRASSGDWYGNYSPKRGTRLPAADTITLRINGTVIGPLSLVPPKTADTLERLGSNDEQQGIRVTAFPTDLGNGLVRVQLIPKLQDANLSVTSYGVSPLVKDAGLYIEDTSGAKQKLQNDDTMSRPSDFRFREAVEGGPYTVVIPFLEISDSKAISDLEVKLPVPPVGSSREVDVSTAISGFPVHFTRVERTGETAVSIDVDVHFDPSKPQTLEYFMIRYPGSPFNESFGWESVEKSSSAMKQLHLEVQPDQTELRFSLAEPYIIVKGPWRLPIEP